MLPIIPIHSLSPATLHTAAPIGAEADVAHLLAVDQLHARGMTGRGVPVVIEDTGINMTYLAQHGKRPAFDREASWSPRGDPHLGRMAVGHGTMCAYDVCIAAPECTLIDHALLTSHRLGASRIQGLLSDAVQSYDRLLEYVRQRKPRALVVSNSWAVSDPGWDFPVGHPANYSDNPDHPFNVIVSELEAVGADILFPSGNCSDDTAAFGILGANSSESALCVAAVTVHKERLSYSAQGPGRLVPEKPDIAAFAHFDGSGVAIADMGTSAATPVVAGVIAAIRTKHSPNALPPKVLRTLLRETAEAQGPNRFDHEYGYGVINVPALLERLDDLI